jgi:predicted MFS family arabinose efflux permease
VPALLRPYRDVLTVPGAAAFSGSALLARLPISMLGIGLVLLVSGTRGSYADAGAVAAAALVAGSLVAPLQARLADRWGQARVIAPLLLLHSVALVVGVWAAAEERSLLMVSLAAAVAGAALPQFGAFVRARWSAVLTGTGRLPTAFAWESVLDEVIFVLGPVVVTVVATTVSPVVAVLGTLLFTVGGGLAYLACRSTVPPRHEPVPTQSRDRLPLRTLAALMAAFAALGAVFGAVEVATVAFAEEQGRQVAAGLVLAAFSAGSLVSGVVFGAVASGAPTRGRLVVGQMVLTVALVPALTIGSLPVLAAVLALAGVSISPSLITGFGLAEATSPRSRVTEALAWTSTALGVGVAAGAALAGPVIDGSGAARAFLVPVLAAGAAVVCALLLPRQRATTTRDDADPRVLA